MSKYGKRGRPSYKDVKNLKIANALLTTDTAKDAYLKVHPNASPETARCHGGEMITPEVLAEVRRILATDPMINITKDAVVRMLMVVISQYFQGKAKAQDYLRAVENLKELCPEFKQRFEHDDLQKRTAKEIDDELRRLAPELFQPKKEGEEIKNETPPAADM